MEAGGRASWDVTVLKCIDQGQRPLLMKIPVLSSTSDRFLGCRIKYSSESVKGLVP